MSLSELGAVFCCNFFVIFLWLGDISEIDLSNSDHIRPPQKLTYRVLVAGGGQQLDSPTGKGRL